ncbi:MAG: DUF5763 domain-containing protein [Thermomicrobiales bacterium]
MGSNTKKCAGVKKDGSPCTAPAMTESAFCYAHDPSRRTARDEARRKGGRNRANSARRERRWGGPMRGVYDQLMTAMQEVHDGELLPARATAMASLARSIVLTHQIGEVEERLSALERAVAESEEAGD